MAAPVQRHIGVDHGDPLGRGGQRRPAVDDHVAVEGNGGAWTGEVRGDDPVGRRPLTACGQFGCLVLRAHEVLEAPAGEFGRVAHDHHVVERDGVVVPLVDGLGHVAGLVVEVAQVDRHGVGRHGDAVDHRHHIGDLGAQAEVPQEERAVATTPNRLLDPVAGTTGMGPEPSGRVEQDSGTLVGQHAERLGGCHGCGRRFNLIGRIPELGEAPGGRRFAQC